MVQNTQSRGSENGMHASDLKDKAADQLNKFTGQAQDQLNNVADAVEDVATRVAEQGRAAGEQLRQVAGNISGAVDKSVKEQPVATLAVVAALGFVLGAIWKS